MKRCIDNINVGDWVRIGFGRYGFVSNLNQPISTLDWKVLSIEESTRSSKYGPILVLGSETPHRYLPTIKTHNPDYPTFIYTTEFQSHNHFFAIIKDKK